MSLKDKVVLITGAGRGIGAGIAACFAAKGARVVITDLDQGLVDAAAAALDTDALGLVCDASSQVEMAAAIDQVVERFGGLDILVNNAGVGGLNVEYQEFATESALLSMTDEGWDEQLR